VNRFHAFGRVHSAVFYIDGKVGAQESTQPTVDAVGVIGKLRGMVAFRIGAFGHDQHTLRAELDAESASFASFLDDVNNAMGYLDAVPIQGLSPIRHIPPSILP
jgi:hypothetical protein